MEGENGGWLVFQQRFDGSVSFNRTWHDYKNGFGDVDGEFWMGNKWIHLLTSSGKYDLYVIATDKANQTEVKRFKHFTIGSESEKYVFNYEAVYDGYSEHELFTKYIKNMSFSTPDQDVKDKDCSIKYQGGWWFDMCFHDYFNGPYNGVGLAKGIHWGEFTGHGKSLAKTMMMIKEK